MDHIEMLWKCNICFTINGGLSKVCKGCGKALDTEEWFMPDDISTNANLYKPEDLDKALRGPDWHCPSCHSSQRQGDGQCANCGDKEIHSSNNITPLRPEYSELIFTKPFCQLPTGLACRLVRSLAGFRQQGRHMAL